MPLQRSTTAILISLSLPNRTNPQVVELFANHPDTYVQFLGGRFHGKAGARRLYIDRFTKMFVGGRNGPVQGWLLDHLMAQDIVDYDPATQRCQMRARTLMTAGTHESFNSPRPHVQWWEGGVYENEYIKEDGVWKILRLRYFPFWHGTAEHGWRYTKPNYVPFFSKTLEEAPEEGGPDELVKESMLWPDTRVVPFHYPHPVTGKQVDEIDLRAPVLGTDEKEAVGALKVDEWGR